MPRIARRSFTGLAAASWLLPRFAIAAGDNRPSLTIAVPKISTSNTLEPLREQSNVGARIFSTIGEGLIDIDWLDTLRPRAGLAEDWRRIDDRTLELTLRQGVKFHNGDTLTPEDVAFTFGNEHMWSGSLLGTGGMFASNTAGAGSKTPPPEAPALAKAAYPDFEKIEIVDSRTVRFVNKVPDPVLEGRLTRNTGMIFSRRAFNEAESWLAWARKPVATGPYRVVDYRPDSALVLEAHDEYWGGRPPLKGVRFLEVPEVSARVNGLLAGDFDMACDIPPDQIKRVEDSPRHTVRGGMIANNRILVFDKHHPVLANSKMRLALAHAIDRQAIVDALWLGRTKVPKGNQHEFYGDMTISDWSVPQYDPARTKQLMQEAGYQGEEISFQTMNNYYTNQTPTAQLMLEWWRSAGLNVKLEMKENWSQVLGRFPGRGFCDNSNSASFNDPVASMASYYPGGQTWEAGQWENEEARATMQVLQNSMNLETRRKAFRRMLEICERDDPAYTVLHKNATFTALRKELPWRASQAFTMDLTARNWGG